MLASTATTRDLSDRIARFSRTTFVISGVMFAVSFILEMSIGTRQLVENFTNPSRIVHFGATAITLTAWYVCRKAHLSTRALEAIDAGVCISLCVCWPLLAIGLPRSEPIEFSIVLALTYTVIARSVAIPSTFFRTLWISAISVIPTVALLFHRKLSFIPDAKPVQVMTFTVFGTLWCLVAAVTAALNSRLIFGLRQQIKEIGKLGQYTLESKLGEGGMGVVYRATHAMLRRPAAIKLLPPDRASERDLARFEREVQLTSQLNHPNTVSIFDYGRNADGTFYYVMEYLDGLDLEQLVEDRGPLAASRAIHILAQAAGALSEAHALGLIHRDIKPANIMLIERPDAPDVVKVVDFGLVRTVESDKSDLNRTGANAITGTPLYLPPEAITAPDSVDARSDLYALGAVAYYLLTGSHVFSGATVLEVCTKHLHEAPESPSSRLGKEIAADIEALIVACLAKKPADRPESAHSMRAALLACADAAAYDEQAARAWWKDYKAKSRESSKAPRDFQNAPTMAIDLRGRATLSG